MIVVLIIALVLAYVYWRLLKTNMNIGENVERRLPPREALRFALDNDLPLRS